MRFDENQFALNFAKVDLLELLAEVQHERFPDLRVRHDVQFVVMPFVARIHTLPWRRRIDIHHVLNHPDTPAYVFRTLLTHELLHAEMWRRSVADGAAGHTRKFLEEERCLCPEYDSALAWLRQNLASCLSHRQGAFRVSRNWKRLELCSRAPVITSDGK